MVAHSHIYNGIDAACHSRKSSKGSTWQLTCSNEKNVDYNNEEMMWLNQVNQSFQENGLFWPSNIRTVELGILLSEKLALSQSTNSQ